MGEVGLTRDAGYQIGVSRTLPLPAERVWRFMTGEEGLELWLGPSPSVELRRGGGYRTADGAEGEVRGLREGPRYHVRLTHRPPDGAETTVQVAVTPKGERSVLRFHQERMGGPRERARRREHWRRIMDSVEGTLTPAGQ
ncbi:SRPBCC family protein [Nocardiopsis lucentensis]|uniref:SRPBCC family protein n=1 Tax=Nocardiopsis lucentensis TaxID=53441 RepID=UPI00034B1A45|nr:SRPBCC domain-containing protein [Nocardiopsis lucentensis]